MGRIKLYGYPDSYEMYPVRDFLKRSVVEFDWTDISTPEMRDNPKVAGLQRDAFAIEFCDGSFVVEPSLEEIATRLGWIRKPKYPEYDVAIYGAGPAGLSAAVYAASEGLKTILVEKEAVGGQAGTSTLIENYMGFPGGISGAELAERARQQAQGFGAEILLLRKGIKGTFHDNRLYAELEDGEHLISRCGICCTGVDYAKLGLPNEDTFLHKGLYYGAGASEACFCNGKDVHIVGGGNSAGQAASYFSQFARKVYMVIRKGNLSDTLSDYLVKRVTQNNCIEILYNSEVTELEGEGVLNRIRITNRVDGSDTWHDTFKLFICIGGKPNTAWADGTNIIRDQNDYLVTGTDLLDRDDFKARWNLDRHPYHLETSVPGQFAAGDVRFSSVKRVASAVGEGAMAVTLVHQYLSNT